MYAIRSYYEEAEKIAEKIGYPVLLRPSYVLGGRAMELVYDVEGVITSYSIHYTKLYEDCSASRSRARRRSRS